MIRSWRTVLSLYRGTLPIRNSAPLGPYRNTSLIRNTPVVQMIIAGPPAHVAEAGEIQPCTLNPEPQTLNPAPQTLNPEP